MVFEPHLSRYVSRDVTLLGDTRRPGGVTLAFTERAGGYSRPPYASLNLGDACGDDPAAVAANRRQLLQALGAGHLAGRLVNPRQVHGCEVLAITSGGAEAVSRAQEDARDGVDAVACTAADVPVLLCFADCVPVILVAPGGFAVVHSGWKGTLARISARALGVLVAEASCAPEDVICYVGPHIGAADYEVSPELAERFAEEFGEGVVAGENHLDLGAAVCAALVAAGVRPEAILDECPSTASCTRRFFSYRAEGGTCGRHGAIALIQADQGDGTDER